MAAALEANKILEEISVGSAIVGSTVKLKSSGKLKVLTDVASDGDVKYEDSDLSLIHISEPTRQAEISYAVFCLKKKK